MFADYETTETFFVGINEDDLETLVEEGRAEIPGRSHYDKIVISVSDDDN